MQGVLVHEIVEDTLLAIAVIVSALMNILIKVLSKVFSQLERHHSFTDREKAVSNKLTAALTVNMVLLTLALSADVSSLSGIPFLFKGSFADVTRDWYEEFANRFCQVALINAIMFPISCANPILKWRGTCSCARSSSTRSVSSTSCTFLPSTSSPSAAVCSPPLSSTPSFSVPACPCCTCS